MTQIKNKKESKFPQRKHNIFMALDLCVSIEHNLKYYCCFLEASSFRLASETVRLNN